jgi:hypothetical protein
VFYIVEAMFFHTYQAICTCCVVSFYGACVVAHAVLRLAPGTDVMILKIFSPKNSAKKLAF